MTTLNFDVLWRDHGAQKGMRDLGNQTETAHRSFSKFKTVAVAAGIATGAALIKFGKDSVQAFSESQDAQKALGFAFQKFPKLADTNQASLQKLNSELQKKTRFDDDNIASGQAVLAQFKLTGKQLTEVTPLLLDYASKTGKDIPSAARDVGKALLGNAKALKNIGISYKSTGNSATDFTNITNLMREKIGGFADREGQTFSGQLAIMKNQFGELEETAGSKLVPALTAVVGGLTHLVEFVGANSRVIIPLVGTVAGLAGTIWLANKATTAWRISQSLMTGLGRGTVTGLNALKVAFTGVEISAGAAGRAMKIAQLSIPVIGIALFAVTTALSIFASKADAATTQTNDFDQAMQSVKGTVTRATAALNENVRAQAVTSLQQKGAYDQARLLGLSYGMVTDAALGNKTAIGQVNHALSAALALNPSVSKSNSDMRNAAVGLSGSLGDVAHSSINAVNAERVRRGAMVAGTTATDELAAATRQLKDADTKLNGELQKSIDKFTILRNGALSVEHADEAWQQSLDDVRTAAKENGRTLDIHTQKGRNNRQAILNMITALNDHVTADVKAAGATRKGESATDRFSRVLRIATTDTRHGEDAIRRAGRAAGFNKDQVDAMIRKYAKTPKKVETDVKANGVGKTVGDMDRIDRHIRGINSRKVRIDFATNAFSIAGTKFKVNLTAPSSVGRSAAGGLIRGPGTGTSDSIPRWLSDGEFVVNAAATRRNRAHLEAINAGMAAGGVVSRSVRVNSGRVPEAASQFPGVLNWFGKAAAVEAGRVIGKGLASGLMDGANVGNPHGLVRVNNGSWSRLFAANIHRAEASVGRHFVVFQGGWNHGRVAASGTTHDGDAIDARQDGALLHAFRRFVGAMWFRNWPGNYHMHGVPAPGRGYGSASARWQYQDYLRGGDGLASGGVAMRPGLYPLAERGPERVLPTGVTRSFDNLVRVIGANGGAAKVEYHFHADNYVGSKDDLRRWFVDTARSGRLDVVIKR